MVTAVTMAADRMTPTMVTRVRVRFFFQSLEGYLVKDIHERATCLSSRTTFPSAMQIIRSAWSAIFSSCVTMMRV